MAIVISIISILIALVALAVNVSGLVRRPRIVAEWGWVQESPPYEGLSVIVTARRRAIEIDEVGVVLLSKRPWRRRSPEWLNVDDPFRISLSTRTEKPTILQDGQTIRGFGELEAVAADLGDRDGALYAFVAGSGTVYLTSPNSKLRKRLRRRVGS